MRVYFDTSALLKRIFIEAESEALVDAVAEYQETGCALVSSSLAWIEVARAAEMRAGKVVSPGDFVADDALAGIAEHPINAEVVALARRLKPPVLRTLDAIHLASAALLDADVVVAYDLRLLAACRENQLVMVSPGA